MNIVYKISRTKLDVLIIGYFKTEFETKQIINKLLPLKQIFMQYCVTAQKNKVCVH